MVYETAQDVVHELEQLGRPQSWFLSVLNDRGYCPKSQHIPNIVHDGYSITLSDYQDDIDYLLNNDLVIVNNMIGDMFPCYYLSDKGKSLMRYMVYIKDNVHPMDAGHYLLWSMK